MRSRKLIPCRWPLVAVLGLVCVLFGPGAGLVLGQPAPDPAGPDAASPQDAAAPGEIKVEIEKFGVGDAVRVGDLIGVRLRLMDSALKPRDIIVQMPGFDPDGDRALVQREITSNPGSWYGVWLYFRVPAGATASSAFEVRVYESLEGGRTGKLLGQAFLTARQVSQEPEDLIAVIGSKTYGLGTYNERLASAVPQGHELIRIVTGIQPEDAPDRWMGWAPFSVLVWGAGDPGKLRGERARALREWIERGGHLVVLLPPYGETWTNPSANELNDLLPAVKLTRQEGVDLASYAALLTRRRNPTLPKDAVVHTMAPMPGVGVADAGRIFSNPDGDCVVARRLVGLGAVDLVGLDLNARAFTDQGALDADVFWNRLLGRRGDIRTQQEINQLNTAGNINTGGTNPADYEADIPRLIAKTGDAGAALILGVVVFVVYWLVAGPGGFALLKRRGLQRHAWVGYATAAAAFTLIAWGGATALRPAHVEADHFTLIDHVFGQPVERTRTWASLLIPWYGEATMEVGHEEDPASPGRAKFTNIISPWAPTDSRGGGGRGSFPDARGYDVDVRTPWKMTPPTRSTVKQLVADWAGTPVWKMPVPVGDQPTIRRMAGGQLEGVLRHQLPAAMHDVVIIDVFGQLSLAARPGAPVSNARAYKITGEWAPGADLNLAEVTKDSGSSSNYADNYLKQLADSARGWTGVVPGQEKAPMVGESQRLMALTLYAQLQPPDLLNTREPPVRVRRAETHGWDLGRWFSQPCVIIVGQVGTDDKKIESPTPLLVNGQPVRTQGRTLVRWVFPLADSPPAYPVKDDTVAPAAGLAPAGPAQPDATPDKKGK